jgi:hypothetical protein
LPEEGTAFLRPLKNKGFEKESEPTMGLYDLVTSTTLESNKSHPTLELVLVRLEGEASAAVRPPSFHAIGSQTVRRRAASQPVLTRYNLREIERSGYTYLYSDL